MVINRRVYMNKTSRYVPLFVLLLIATAFLPVLPASADSRAYTSHAAIVIASDVDFTAANGMTAGTGSSADPYIISGWEIPAGNGNAISISGTTSYFKITGCKLTGASNVGNGVALSGVQNGKVESSVFENLTDGIAIAANTHIDASLNTFTNDVTGVAVSGGSGSHIFSNTFNTGATGIALASAHGAEVNLNKFNTMVSGINIASTDTTKIHHNQFEKGGTAISIASSGTIAINNNEFMNQTSNAISIGTVDAGIVIYYNDFKNNHPGSSQAATSATNVMFYNSTLSKGNYWSDWTSPDANSDGIVDQPYVVTAGKASDNFPLTSPLIGAPTIQPLTTSLSVDKHNGTAPLLVTFTAITSGGTGPYTHNITYGDGASSATLTHTYGSGGTFVAFDTVKDSKGATKVSNSVSISLIAQLNVTIGTTTKTGKVPLAVGFSSSVKGGVAPYNYTWEFGDGKTSNEANPAHVFKNQGIFTTKLTVRDSKGTTKDETVRIVAVKASLPKGFIPGFETPILVISLVAALVLVWRKKTN
jgi:hypothetical protein